MSSRPIALDSGRGSEPVPGRDALSVELAPDGA
jgi:hypothetical protein